jgi:hypothetical protein
VLRSGVESVAFLALGLRQAARCARRLACATRTGHSLLSVLPPKKLLERTESSARNRTNAIRRCSNEEGANGRWLAFLGARDLFLRFFVAIRRAVSLLGVGWPRVARFSANAPSGDSWCRDGAIQRLLTTTSAIRRLLETQLVRARDSFGRHQNCTALASGLRPEHDRGCRAQRLRLIRMHPADRDCTTDIDSLPASAAATMMVRRSDLAGCQRTKRASEELRMPQNLRLAPPQLRFTPCNCAQKPTSGSWHSRCISSGQ